ncbi:NnrS family protein [Photobacterium indicum]|uniref:NnrS family protein n=1 Tax=Photobacterium indicum TaxID=81447 RepID=UPI003D0D73DF
MMQILDNEKEQRILPIFRLAFRPFFLGASIFSAIAMIIWAIFWSGKIDVSMLMYGNPIWWHSHEMLIGFTGAIIIGFLLTAVQNWTGSPGVRGWPLASIFLLWAIARVGLLFGTANIIWMVIDLTWVPLATYFLAKPLILRKQWNNLFFVPLLLLMTLLNAYLHFMVLGFVDFDLRGVSLSVVTVISVIVLVVGGRVIPFFTWRGTDTAQITRVKAIELLAMIPSWLLLANVLLPLPDAINQVTLPALFFATGLTHLIRFVRWRTFQTLKTPLLWSLHAAYLFMIIGMFMLGFHFLTGDISYSVALHFITVGGIGCMILAMISRVSLGHTGRSLQAGRWIIIAFLALIIATLVRTVMVSLVPTMILNSYVVSAVLWAVAFTIFSIVYFPILTQPRVDGRPG